MASVWTDRDEPGIFEDRGPAQGWPPRDQVDLAQWVDAKIYATLFPGELIWHDESEDGPPVWTASYYDHDEHARVPVPCFYDGDGRLWSRVVPQLLRMWPGARMSAVYMSESGLFAVEFAWVGDVVVCGWASDEDHDQATVRAIYLFLQATGDNPGDNPFNLSGYTREPRE